MPHPRVQRRASAIGTLPELLYLASSVVSLIVSDRDASPQPNRRTFFPMPHPRVLARVQHILLVVSGLFTSGILYARLLDGIGRDRLAAWRDRFAPVRRNPLFNGFWSLIRAVFMLHWVIMRYGLHFMVSYMVFGYVYGRVEQYAVDFMSGWWGAPYFPIYRTMFVYTLATIPIWGAVMSALGAVWLALQLVWGCVQSYVHRQGQQYRRVPLDMEMEPLTGDDDKEFSSAADSSARTPRHKRSLVRIILWTLVYTGYFSAALFGVYMLKTYEHPGDHRYKQDVEKANSLPRREGYHNGDKIFIAAMFFNNGGMLPYWITEITKFIYYVGTDNVFVSIVESNSDDTTPQLLEDFDTTLKLMGVARRILTHESSIKKPDDMKTATPRIEFLASLRNLVMQPLVEKGGYDRVIFTNDILIEAESVVELLTTRNGDYDYVCGLDFGPWGLFDQWVIRDRLGRIISTVWPFFFEDKGTGPVKQDEPATVFACWNGIVAFNPEPFVPIPLRTPGRLSTSPLSRPLAPSHPAFPQSPDLTPAQTPPLRFRASIDREECFSSESFLLPYDMRRQFDMQNMYVNPRVISAYEWKYYMWYKYVLRHWAVIWFINRFENGFGLQYAITKVVGGGDRIFTWDGGECDAQYPH